MRYYIRVCDRLHILKVWICHRDQLCLENRSQEDQFLLYSLEDPFNDLQIVKTNNLSCTSMCRRIILCQKQGLSYSWPVSISFVVRSQARKKI